jgi:hypothetical protein
LLPTEVDASGALGYRGMIVRLRGPKPREIVVHKGVVAALGIRSSDPGRHVERWLLESGRSFVAPDIYAIVAGEL